MRKVKLLHSLTSFIFNTLLPLCSSLHREYLTPQLFCAKLRGSGCQESRCNSRLCWNHHTTATTLSFRQSVLGSAGAVTCWTQDTKTCAWAILRERCNIAYSPHLQRANRGLYRGAFPWQKASTSPAPSAEKQDRQSSTDLQERENKAPARLKICMFIIKMFRGYFCFSLKEASCF